MTTQAVERQIPPNWPGSLPEWLVFENLTTRQGLTHGVDFTYQSPLQGGRMQRGGLIVDFMFSNPPNLAFSVMGTYYHYGLGSGIQARDLMQRAQLAGGGTTLIFLDEDDIYEDVNGVVSAGLRYQDRSLAARSI
jgi:hypothetical protein